MNNKQQQNRDDIRLECAIKLGYWISTVGLHHDLDPLFKRWESNRWANKKPRIIISSINEGVCILYICLLEIQKDPVDNKDNFIRPEKLISDEAFEKISRIITEDEDDTRVFGTYTIFVDNMYSAIKFAEQILDIIDKDKETEDYE